MIVEDDLKRELIEMKDQLVAPEAALLHDEVARRARVRRRSKTLGGVVAAVMVGGLVGAYLNNGETEVVVSTQSPIEDTPDSNGGSSMGEQPSEDNGANSLQAGLIVSTEGATPVRAGSEIVVAAESGEPLGATVTLELQTGDGWLPVVEALVAQEIGQGSFVALGEPVVTPLVGLVEATFVIPSGTQAGSYRVCMPRTDTCAGLEVAPQG